MGGSDPCLFVKHPLRPNFLLLIVLCFLLLPACGSKQTDNTYTIAFTVRDVPSVFTSLAHGGPHMVITTFLFDSLVWKDENGFVPLLAEKWQASDDKKTYTFNLRPNVRWHDGQPFTAGDVKFTFEYLRDNPLPISAAEANNAIESVEAGDSQTVVFHLKDSAPDFVNNIAGQTQIIPKHIWQNVTEPLKFQEPGAFVGTGPFKFKETRRGEFHVFEANTDYFLGRPGIDRLIFKNANNPLLALESGDVDAASPSSPTALLSFQGRDEYEILKGPYSYYLTKLVFNVKRSPFDSKDLRQAVAYSLNRPEIVKQVLNGEGIVSSSGLLHPDSVWFAKDLPKYEQDLEKAEELFNKAGFAQKDADGTRQNAAGQKLAFTLFTRSDSDEMVREAELIRDQLAQVGIKLDIKPLTTGPQESVLTKGDFDIALDSHGGSISLSIPATNPDFPARGYQNGELTSLYNEFLTSLDKNKRREAAYKIQHIIAEDLPSLPVYNPSSAVVFRKNKGVKWFWTKDGLSGGAPIWWNKLALLKRQ